VSVVVVDPSGVETVIFRSVVVDFLSQPAMTAEAMHNATQRKRLRFITGEFLTGCAMHSPQTICVEGLLYKEDYLHFLVRRTELVVFGRSRPSLIFRVTSRQSR
jgi:hypothetical protein